MTPAERLQQAREAARIERAKDDAKRQKMQLEHDRRQRIFERTVAPFLRPARPEEYSRWVRGYLERGGVLGYVSEHPMPRGFYVATGAFTLLPLFGASLVRVIVPNGIDVEVPDAFTHNDVFFMEGFRMASPVDRPTAYSDTVID